MKKPHLKYVMNVGYLIYDDHHVDDQSPFQHSL